MPKAPPCSMAELVAMLKIETGREHKDGWREAHCPYHYKQRKDAVFYVNFEFNSWNCYHACPGCPGVGQRSGSVLTLFARYTGIEDKIEATKYIKNTLWQGGSVIRARAKVIAAEPTAPRTPLADIKERDETYCALLEMLSLASEHRRDLRARGLNDEQIELLGYKSVPVVGRYSIAKQLATQGCTLIGVPGFYTDAKGAPMANFSINGFFKPVKDRFGRIEMLQIRRDKSADENNNTGIKKRPKYLMFSTSNPKYANGTGVPNVANYAGFPKDGSIPKNISFTEGYVKSDIAAVLSNTPFVGFGSTSCFRLFEQILAELAAGGMKQGWECMDKDRTFNGEVLKDIQEQYRIAAELGIPYKTYPWDPKYKGVDDFLAARQRIREGRLIA